MTVLHGELGGRYRPGERIAVGGQGAVYAAVDERDGRQLVVKVALAPGDDRTRAAAARLAALAEDPTLGPHVVPVWDVGRWDDRDFAALERLEGTLADRPADPSGVGRGGDDARVLAALLRAVAAFEARGEVHGDLKPSNVFVRDDEGGPAVLLGDLWCGRPPAPVSPGFTAPEVWRGASPSPASDRYSLGATLWAVLAGKPPACAVGGPHATKPGRAAVAEAGIRPPWDAVVVALLDPDPDRRPTVAEVIDSVEGRGPRRHRGLVLAGVAVPVAVAIAVLSWRTSPAVDCPAGFPWDGATCRHPDGRAVVSVPAGTYVQGSADADRTWAVDAVRRRVTLTRPTWFRSTEVTQREYRDVLGEDPVRDRQEVLPDGEVVPCATWAGASQVGDDLPVACVGWHDAVRLANAESLRDGLTPAYDVGDDGAVAWDRDADGWRLPTEAEWEWAAGAGDRREAWAGATGRDDVCTHANVRAHDAPEAWGNEVSCDDGAPVLAPVASHAPNGLGLYDMLGNVAEWTWDRYGDRSPDPATDPVGPDAGAMRVYRGAAWNQVARPISARYASPPDAYDLNGGIRLVRSAPRGPWGR